MNMKYKGTPLASQIFTNKYKTGLTLYVTMTLMWNIKELPTAMKLFSQDVSIWSSHGIDMKFGWHSANFFSSSYKMDRNIILIL